MNLEEKVEELGFTSVQDLLVDRPLIERSIDELNDMIETVVIGILNPDIMWNVFTIANKQIILGAFLAVAVREKELRK